MCPVGQTFDRILYSCSTSLRRCQAACPPSRADYRNYTSCPSTTTANSVTSLQSEPISTVSVAVVTAGQSDTSNLFTTGLAMTSLSTNSSTTGATTLTSSSTTYTTTNFAVNAAMSATSTGSSSLDEHTTTMPSVTSLDYVVSSLMASKSSKQPLTSSPVQNTTATLSSADLIQMSSQGTGDLQLSTRRSYDAETSSSATTATYLLQSLSTATDRGGNMTYATDANLGGPTTGFNASTSRYVDSIVTQPSSAASITQSSSITQSPGIQIAPSVSSMWNYKTVANNSTLSPQRDERTTSTQPSILNANSTLQSNEKDLTTTTTVLELTTSILSQQVSTVLTTDVQRSLLSLTIPNIVDQNVTSSASQSSTSTQFVLSVQNKTSNQMQRTITSAARRLTTSNQTIFPVITSSVAQTNAGQDTQSTIVPSMAPLTSVPLLMWSTGNGTQSSIVPSMAPPTSVPSLISSTGNATQSSIVPSMAPLTSVPALISSTANQYIPHNDTRSDYEDTSERPSSSSVFFMTSTAVYQIPADNTTSYQGSLIFLGVFF